MASADRQSQKPIRVQTKRTFEATALGARLGDAAAHLLDPGGSNYGIAAISANTSAFGLALFPMTPAELEGAEGDFRPLGSFLKRFAGFFGLPE